jgi:hypothetical protein
MRWLLRLRSAIGLTPSQEPIVGMDHETDVNDRT